MKSSFISTNKDKRLDVLQQIYNVISLPPLVESFGLVGIHSSSVNTSVKSSESVGLDLPLSGVCGICNQHQSIFTSEIHSNQDQRRHIHLEYCFASVNTVVHLSDSVQC